jgi:hypothetical protein
MEGWGRGGDAEMTSDAHHWTYSEWLKHTVDKIVTLGLQAPAEHREAYLRSR